MAHESKDDKKEEGSWWAPFFVGVAVVVVGGFVVGELRWARNRQRLQALAEEEEDAF